MSASRRPKDLRRISPRWRLRRAQPAPRVEAQLRRHVLLNDLPGQPGVWQPLERRRDPCLFENPITLRAAMLNEQTRQDLAEHQALPTVLRALQVQIGVGERDIARLTDKEMRTVRRWLAGALPKGDSAERIDELRAIVTVLGQLLDPEGIVAWLRNRNERLGFRRPLDVLAQGGDGFDEVLGAARDLIEGMFT
jgi:hypothetical protein